MAEPRVPQTGTSTVAQAIWDGEALLGAMSAATARLTRARDEINALNVFPVPDGDTGTNMSMTMRSALDAASKLDAGERSRIGEVANRLAFGALMGARGNSGVILSQVLRGFAMPLAELDAIDGRDLARAFTSASAMAYKAVMKPVEGTMLSVARGAAEAAERAAVATASLSAVLDDAVAGAVAALAATPDQLPILKQAGVVDAGGHGIVLILRACRDFARGDTDGVTATASDAVPVGEAMEFFDNLDDLHEADEFGYCTNFMVFADGLDFARERDAIAAMGQSAVIVGDESMLKVHIHTEHPGEVLEYAIGLGELDQVRIDSMTRRTRLLEGQRANARAAHENGLVLTRTPETKLAILAVASGEGISDALRSMGASGIVPGGQTMNPSTEEMLAAVNAVDNESVLLLPNNRNILMAASQVPMLTDKAIRIVPTRSIPQGLASLAAYNDELSLDANLKAMTAAAAGVTTVELVRAVRNAKIGQIKVRRGQILGLHDEAIVAAGDDEVDVLRAAVASADHQDAELVTIFTGEGVTDAEADAVRRACAALLPGAEIESHPGGQPHIRFIISIE